MKIEKLTENKIRVIMNFKDIENNTNDLHSFFNNMANSQNIFLDILEKAEKEVNFHTEGCKLLIEAFSTFEDSIVFTITKFSTNDIAPISNNKSKLTVKRKIHNPNLKNAVYEFNNFYCFCDFCKFISNISNIETQKIAKKIVLYNYQNKFYLIFKDINLKYEYIHKFFNILSEFSKFQNYSNNFEYKLSEHGRAFIKSNAIFKGIKYLI